jgi:hypothetical protein
MPVAAKLSPTSRLIRGPTVNSLGIFSPLVSVFTPEGAENEEKNF